MELTQLERQRLRYYYGPGKIVLDQQLLQTIIERHDVLHKELSNHAPGSYEYREVLQKCNGQATFGSLVSKSLRSDNTGVLFQASRIGNAYYTLTQGDLEVMANMSSKFNAELLVPDSCAAGLQTFSALIRTNSNSNAEGIVSALKLHRFSSVAYPLEFEPTLTILGYTNLSSSSRSFKE